MASSIPADSRDTLEKTVELKVAMDDALEGYETMLEKAEPSFKPTVSGLLAHHRAARADIDALLRERGVNVDDDGSIMGTVHKTVVTLRSIVDDVDRDFIPGILDGENRNLRKYDDAIAEDSADAALQATLAKHRTELERLVSALDGERQRSRHTAN